MSDFQAFAVRGISGPVVTLQAGVDFGGYYWTTTSRRAAKVAALRRNSSASVLSRKNESWRLRAGHSIVIDPCRPPEGVRELPVLALAGSALALIAVRHPEQLLGYVADAASTPKAWRLHHRVLIAVRHEEELVWTDDGVITHQTDRFRDDPGVQQTSARPTRRRSTARRHRHTPLDFDGNCWLGLDSAAGPIALPGGWRAASSTARVHAPVLAAVKPLLPGSACVTIDDSDSPRPSHKSGIIARGAGSLSHIRAGVASIVVDVDSTTTWNGFRSTVT
ncbi:MAG TPA: hypothetical protein VLD86_03195, partial [Ilumatobacteraceae bacterium]|nr:hypothetical protein [Ilumatobacteraceae bacterium]